MLHGLKRAVEGTILRARDSNLVVLNLIAILALVAFLALVLIDSRFQVVVSSAPPQPMSGYTSALTE